MSEGDSKSPSGGASARACPICGRPAVRAYKPFCSARCADVDLNRWLSEVYRVPAPDPEVGDDAELHEAEPGLRRGA